MYFSLCVHILSLTLDLMLAAEMHSTEEHVVVNENSVLPWRYLRSDPLRERV